METLGIEMLNGVGPGDAAVNGERERGVFEDVHRLRVTRLTLTRFRGYGHARVQSDSRIVVLTGPNGAGKTNMLEAVSFLTPGRGMRRARLRDVALSVPLSGRGDGAESVSSGARGAASPIAWAVAACVETPGGKVDLGTGFDDDCRGAERRVVRIDGEGVKSQTALSEHFSALWLTPQMDRLFVDGSDARRRFLDRLVFGFDPAHIGRTNAYRHALRERAKLLKGGAPDARWLDALEETIARRAVAVAAARQEMSRRLDRHCQSSRPPFPVARVALDGSVERWLDEDPALAVEERLRRILYDARSFDARYGGAGGGNRDVVLPHRTDLRVRYEAKGRDAQMCSTGEQKMLLTGLVLAGARMLCAERGVAPVLLFDEVAAHLDEAHRGALFDAALDVGGQLWLTGTDPTLFAPLSGQGQFYRVENAQLTQIN